VLEALGLDRHAVEVYRLLLERRDWGVSQLAEHLGLTEATVRQTLDRLVDADLLRSSWDRPGQLRPVNPDVGLAALVAREQVELTRRQHEIERTRRDIALIVADLASSPERTAPAIVRHLGMDAVQSCLESLERSTRLEALSFSPGGAQSVESLEASAPLDRSALARGVRIRNIYLDSVTNHPPSRRYMSWLTELGGECRTAATLPLRMLICDRETALLPLDPDNSKAGALAVRDPATLVALCALFESYWETARPFGAAAAPRPAVDLTESEREVLRLLAGGAKDESVARALGVSVRTARRLVAELMVRLEATSRFQAGANAAKAGWL
jgi:DNA-binding CsgD family transcriptional regulator/sugar-specific transcriptional regulator TrmB